MTVSAIHLQADAWRDFAGPRSRFDVEKKADESAQFSIDSRAHGFAVPTKLVGTKEFQDNIENLVFHEAGHAELDAVEEGDSIYLLWAGFFLGRLQSKHEGWLRPLLKTYRLKFHVLQVTGGEKDKPTCGVNVVISGIDEALAAFEKGYGWHVKLKKQAAPVAA